MSKNEELLSAYREPYDPTKAIAVVKQEWLNDEAWAEFWNELHHQGDVDTASYFAVVELVSVYQAKPCADWNIYSLVTVIELCRPLQGNPEIPAWLAPAYSAAIEALAIVGLEELKGSSEGNLVVSVIGLVALVKKLPYLAKFALMEADEQRELLGEELSD